jgi:hypothetical protein
MMNIQSKSKRKIKDYIQVFNNIMTPYVCKLVLNECKKSNKWNINENEKINELVDCSIHRMISELCKNNNIYDFDFIQTITHSSEYKFIKQDIGSPIDTLEYFQTIKKSLGILYCSIQLNDDYEGGEFSMFNEEFSVKPKMGSSLLFPLTYMFPYKIMPVLNGSKYSIVTILK